MGLLTEAKIKKLTKGRHSDGKGLYIRVLPSKSKKFVFMKMMKGKRPEIPIATWPDMSLEDARTKAYEMNLALKEKKNPIIETRDAPTLNEAIPKTIEYRKVVRKWQSPEEMIADWHFRLKPVVKKIGEKRLDEITSYEIQKILDKIVEKSVENWKRASRYLNHVYRWADREGLVTFNPVVKIIENTEIPKKQGNHYKALPFFEVENAIKVMRTSTRTNLSTRLCFEFMVMTACRTIEARKMRWEHIGTTKDEISETEIDTWTKPTTKSGRVHIVPLSEQVLAILEQARSLENYDGGYVFPNSERAGEPLSKSAIRQSLKRKGFDGLCTPHGFRKSFRTWADYHSGAEYEVRRLCLSHRVGDVLDDTYSDAIYLDKRLALLQQWADYLTTI